MTARGTWAWSPPGAGAGDLLRTAGPVSGSN
jgi:hypothetical protein